MDEPQKMSVADFAAKIKAKYPDYANVDDAELTRRIVAKYPEYSQYIDVRPDIGKAEAITGPMTTLQKFGAIVRSTARQAPTALGTLLGGLAGGTAGAPAGPPGVFGGATVGAGAGAGLGELGLTGLQHLPAPIGTTRESLFGEPPKTGREAVGNIASQANWGMAAEAGGRGLAEILPTLFARSLKPQVEKELAILEREGVPYTAGDVRPGGAAQIVENLNRGTLLGGRVMQQSDVEQARRLFTFKQRLLDSIGPLYSKEEAGKMVQDAVEHRADQLFSQGGLFDKAYQRVSQLYPATVDTARIRGEVQPLRNEVAKLVSEGRIPSASSPEAPSRFLKLLDDLSNYGTREVQTPQGIQKIDVPISYGDVWKDKQTIDSIIRNLGDDSMRTRAKAVVQRVHNILDDAMEQAASNVNPKAAQAIRNINKGYANAKRLMETESLVADMRNGKMNPEAIVGRFFNPGSVTPAKDLLRAIPPDQKARMLPVLRRRSLENLFEQSTKAVEGEDFAVTSGKQLETRFLKSRDDLKTLLTPDQMSAAQDFIDASKRAQISGTMTNPASGRQLLAWSQVGSALQFMGAGIGLVTGQSVGDKFLFEGMAFIGPDIVARAMTNPRLARLLAKGFTMNASTAAKIGWTPRIMNLLRISEEKTPTDQNKE